MAVVEYELKSAMHQSKITLKDVSDKLGIPYGTLSCQINGFTPMSSETRKAIVKIIEEKNSINNLEND